MDPARNYGRESGTGESQEQNVEGVDQPGQEVDQGNIEPQPISEEERLRRFNENMRLFLGTSRNTQAPANPQHRATSVPAPTTASNLTRAAALRPRIDPEISRTLVEHLASLNIDIDLIPEPATRGEHGGARPKQLNISRIPKRRNITPAVSQEDKARRERNRQFAAQRESHGQMQTAQQLVPNFPLHEHSQGPHIPAVVPNVASGSRSHATATEADSHQSSTVSSPQKKSTPSAIPKLINKRSSPHSKDISKGSCGSPKPNLIKKTVKASGDSHKSSKESAKKNVEKSSKPSQPVKPFSGRRTDKKNLHHNVSHRMQGFTQRMPGFSPAHGVNPTHSHSPWASNHVNTGNLVRIPGRIAAQQHQPRIDAPRGRAMHGHDLIIADPTLHLPTASNIAQPLMQNIEQQQAALQAFQPQASQHHSAAQMPPSLSAPQHIQPNLGGQQFQPAHPQPMQAQPVQPMQAQPAAQWPQPPAALVQPSQPMQELTSSNLAQLPQMSIMDRVLSFMRGSPEPIDPEDFETQDEIDASSNVAVAPEINLSREEILQLVQQLLAADPTDLHDLINEHSPHAAIGAMVPDDEGEVTRTMYVPVSDQGSGSLNPQGEPRRRSDTNLETIEEDPNAEFAATTQSEGALHHRTPRPMQRSNSAPGKSDLLMSDPKGSDALLMFSGVTPIKRTAVGVILSKKDSVLQKFIKMEAEATAEAEHQLAQENLQNIDEDNNATAQQTQDESSSDDESDIFQDALEEEKIPSGLASLRTEDHYNNVWLNKMMDILITSKKEEIRSLTKCGSQWPAKISIQHNFHAPILFTDGRYYTSHTISRKNIEAKRMCHLLSPVE